MRETGPESSGLGTSGQNNNSTQVEVYMSQSVYLQSHVTPTQMMTTQTMTDKLVMTTSTTTATFNTIHASRFIYVTPWTVYPE